MDLILERYIQEVTFMLHQNQLSEEVAESLSALAELAPRFCAEQDFEGSHHQPLQPPGGNGKGTGVHAVLRKRRRAKELCPHRQASRNVTFISL